MAANALARWVIAMPSLAPAPTEPQRLHVPAQAFQSPFDDAEPVAEPVAQDTADEPGTPEEPMAATEPERDRAQPVAPEDEEQAAMQPDELEAWATAPVDLETAEGLRRAFFHADDGTIWVRRDAFEQFSRSQALQAAHAPHRVVLVTEGELPVGLRVEGLRSSSAYGLLGLRDGDILMSVNGTALDSPQRGLAMFGAVQTADTVALSVRRGGGVRTLVFNVR